MGQFWKFQGAERFKFIIIFGIIGLISGLLIFNPVVTQANLEGSFKQSTAAVTLDGRTLFKVSASTELTAKERANIINSRLQTAVDSQTLIQVKLRQHNQLPILLLNDQQLMTITVQDTQAGYSPQAQAERWREIVEQGIYQAQNERSSQFLKTAVLKSSLVILFAIGCHGLFKRIGLKTLRRLLKKILYQPNQSADRSQYRQNLVSLILSLTLGLTRGLLWLTVILYVTEQFPRTRQLKSQIAAALNSTLTTGIITLDDRSYSFPDLLILGGLIWGLFLLAQGFSELLRSRILRVTRMTRSAQDTIAVVVRYSFIAMGTIVLLQVWGLDLSSLTILASALGVGIGFGLQDIAKNFGSGLVLLFERPIQIGDFIELGKYQGIVERVGARSTVIKTLDEVSIIIPNSRFLEEELINWDHDNPVSGLRLPIGVAYGSDVEMVKTALLDVAKANPDVLSKPSPQVIFKGFGESSLNFELRIWTSKPSKQIIIRSNLYFQIEVIFRKRQIEIPFPQRDLHLRGNLPLELSPELQALLLQWLSKAPENGTNINSDEFN